MLFCPAAECRDQIRNSALEVLFDTLKAHGGSFAASFWRRVFDSVLMPIFDHVRAEVTDTTTFTSDKRREKEEFWLYETCKRCLQHLIDVFVTFYDETFELLPQMLQLLAGFINRTHQSLAAGGVYALAHLTNSAGPKLDSAAWNAITSFLLSIAQETAPNAVELLSPPSRAALPPPHPQQQQQQQQQQPQEQGSQPNQPVNAAAGGPQAPQGHQNGSSRLQGSNMAEIHAQGGNQSQSQQQWPGGAGPPGLPPHKRGVGGGPARSGVGPPGGYSLREGIGARRLAKFRSQSAVQLLLVQACSDIYAKQHHVMPASALSLLLQALEQMASLARKVDTDVSLRKRLAMQQAEDKVADDRVVFDPPLLRLETDAAHAYLSVLMHLLTFAPESEAKRLCDVPRRLVQLCQAVLTRFALGKDASRVQPDTQYMADAAAKHAQLQAAAVAHAADTLSNGARSSGSGGFLGVQLGSKSAEAQRRAEKYAAAVAAAMHGRTADQRSIIVGRTSAGVLVLMAAPAVEYAPFTPLINSTLAALAAFDDATFRAHLHEFFPLMVSLISAEYAPVEVLRGLADLMAKRVGPILGVAHIEAAAEMAAAAASARQQAEQQAQALKRQLAAAHPQ